MSVRLRLLLSIAIAVLGVSAAAAPARASKPAPTIEPLPPGPIKSVMIGPQSTYVPACLLGPNGPLAYVVNYLLPPDDAYYTLLQPSACAACNGPGGVSIIGLNFALNFQAACDQPVTVSVVGAQGVAGCRTPDPATVLCPPSSYVLSLSSPGTFGFSILLPAPCCISQDAFMCVSFGQSGSSCSTASTRPRLVTTASCAPCVSYNIYPGGNADLCSPAVAFPGNPVMFANADCCSITPARSGSWGRLKLLYR
jgi:hypothetical protein